ncbi:MAG TPA: homoserine dehydrogenase, partial [Candidatus Limnocylindrales bacterium]|nr:homoserine dehydrogenase [Candidatus Limnocylindrales bacterium]
GPAGGRMLELVAIADLNVQGAVDRGMPREIIVPDAGAVVRRDDVDVIVELLGGDEPARSLIAEALKAGKPVVTANKHVLAHHGLELEAIARAGGAALRYEASVCGGTPVLDTIARGLAANRIRRVRGILNGSTNFILTEMMQARRTYDEVLAAAQAQGYAERDPSADVDGHDAANKLAVLTRLAFGAWPDIDSIVASPPSLRGDGKPGITGVSAADIAGAVALNLAIRLVATASTPGTAEPAFGLAGSVMTCAVPVGAPLGRTDGVLNRLEVDADPVGRVSLEGPGAGGPATSSAILADLLEVVRSGLSTWADLPPAAPDLVTLADDRATVRRPWYVCLPGVLPEEVPGRLAEELVGPPPSSLPRHRSRTWVAVQTRPLPLAEVRATIDPLIDPDRDIPIYPILTS